MRRLTDKQIEVANEIVDRLREKLGDELVAVWLFRWEEGETDYTSPFFHVICSLDGDDDDDRESWSVVFDCIEEIGKARNTGYIEISVVNERGYWDVLYDVYHFDEDKALLYYDRERKTVIRDSKLRNGKAVDIGSELWAMNCENIRRATPGDAYRIAEIEVFNYRMNFYPIFKDDGFYFRELNVKDEAEKLLADGEVLQSTYVYDDGAVKGFITIDGDEVWKLYVEPAVQGQGIGSELLEFAEEMHGAGYLWALEKNERAIRFYKRHGYSPTGERVFEKDTTEFLIRMKKEK